MKKLVSNNLIAVLIAIISIVMLPGSRVFAQENQQAPKKQMLITNVRIFDSKNARLTPKTSVLVEGNEIVKIGKKIDVKIGSQVINGDGYVMTPGFIDAHAHLMLQQSVGELFTTDRFFHAYVASKQAEVYLMRGFTTVRDVGGNTFSLKKAIDRGILKGPRIFPSGPMISQTSGHSDHRNASYESALVGGEMALDFKYGHTAIADGVDEVLKASREALRRGASQIKICVGGGTGSEADPLDVVQYTNEEIKAAVDAASDWGTYVTAHVYNSKGIRRAIDNGLKCIEHGQLMDEETLQYMKENDIWLSPQVIVYTYYPNGFTEDQKKKHHEAYNGIDHMFQTAKKIGFKKIGFGSDIVTDPGMLKRINEEFVHRTKWFDNQEILQQATYNNGQILAMSGERSPYKGKLGVIEKGALADLLLIKGNPLKDISILTKYEENIALIMKDGVIYKNIMK